MSPNPSCCFRAAVLRRLAPWLLAALPAGLAAQPAGTGSVTGRVLDASNAKYLTNAHLVVQGTAIEAYTDYTGQFLLSGVPAGTDQITIFYTGLNQRTVSVAVTPGQTAHLDVQLTSAIEKGEQTIKLDAFVVQAHQETDQQSLAINQQRFSPILESVISTDQFGDVTEGNLSEFMKFMPGVSIEYSNSPEPREIMLRGINPIYTSVRIDGNTVAAAASSVNTRYFETEQISMNNASRIEVNFSRTPEMPASALGGGVNLISKSGFDQTEETLNYRAYLSFNGDARTLGKTPGPVDQVTHKVKPGLDFTWVDPLNKHVAFSVSYLNSTIYYPQNWSSPSWAPISSPTTPGSDLTNPYMRGWELEDGPSAVQRESVGGSLDFKLSDRDTFSIRPQYNFFHSYFDYRDIYFNIQGTANTAPTDWGQGYVDSAPGAAGIQYTGKFREKFGTTWQIDSSYRHLGPVWTITAGTSFSNASNHYHDSQDGSFETVNFFRYNLTESFSGITAIKPQQITVIDKTTGQPFDYTKINQFYLATVSDAEADSTDLFKSAHLDAKRSFGGPFPTSVKVGLLAEDHLRDTTNPSQSWTFVGPNNVAAGKTGNAGDLASTIPGLVDTAFSSTPPPFNFPSVQWPNSFAVYSLYKAHPEYFQWDPANIATAAQNSKYMDELVTAGYLQGDTRALEGRLRFVYGIRFERTRDIGYGYLRNINAEYKQDANGNLILTNGKPTVATGPNGLPLTDASNTVLLDQMEYHTRGLKNEQQYGAGYPSVAATYDLLPNLLARVAYTKALGRPDFSSIIPGTALPDPLSSTPYAITVVNSALAPETANCYDASLDYYFSKVGLIGVAVFRKDFTNFFGSETVPVTAALLSQYNIPDPQYYLDNSGTITSNFNVGSARLTGIQVDYKQVLTFLPIDGFSFFASGYQNHLVAPSFADFSPYIGRAFNAGLSFDRRRYSLKVNFNYRGTERYGASAITDSVGHKTVAYTYYQPRPDVDISANYRLLKHVSVFVAGRNVTDQAQNEQKYGAPLPAYAFLIQRQEYGAQWTVGFKGSF